MIALDSLNERYFMSTDESVATFIQGEPLAVAVEAIEQELTRLWQAAAESSEEDESRAVMRACTLNVLAYSPNEGLYERAVNAIAEFTSRHPCRAIALLADRDAEKDELCAYLSAHCHLPVPKATKVCCEQITVAAKGRSINDIPGIVIPLILRDLPVVLWWQDDLPEEDPLFAQFIAASNHLIFDSADGHDVANVLARAHALCLNWKDGICGDLNWLRLSRYREAVAQFLDSPQAAPLRDHIQEVSIEVEAMTEDGAHRGDAHLAQPLLLLGWLANRLSWKLTEPLTTESVSQLSSLPVDRITEHQTNGITGQPANVFRTGWQGHGREVVGTIRVHQPEDKKPEISTSAGITAVRLQLRKDEASLHFSLQRDSNQPRATMRITQGEQVLTESAVPFPDFSLAELMAQELDRARRDQVYENALGVATQLI
jgi:glucose-6-phosphate dehydrogenase assembly protein OpcA